MILNHQTRWTAAFVTATIDQTFAAPAYFSIYLFLSNMWILLLYLLCHIFLCNINTHIALFVVALTRL